MHLHKLRKMETEKKMENNKRKSGVLLHITSLPNEFTLGTFSSECEKFIDWLQAGGFTVWQVLPITDCGYKWSPYSAMSSFAISPTLIDLTEFLTREELLKYGFDKNGDRLEEENKILSALGDIYDRFGQSVDLTEFEKNNKYWLEDYATFKVLKHIYKNCPWIEFPAVLKNRAKVELDQFRGKHRKEIRKIKYFQYIAWNQWKRVKDYANAKGVEVFGDIPYYTEMESADVWSNPKDWKLDVKGQTELAGVPPDYFNADGQLWGNPIYNFSNMAKNKYAYLTKRFQRQAELFDIVRIDHFIAFSRYWSVPKGSTTAIKGKWVKGVGDSFLKILTTKVNAEIVAENLGIVTKEAEQLREKYGIAGLKVMQFGFDGDGDNMYQPHNYEKNCVAYIGTHDNNTFMGLLNNSDWDKINRFKRYLRIPLEWGNDAVVDNAIITMYRSSAKTIIFTMQDILKLGEEARMNQPGVVCYWDWQLNALPSYDLCGFYHDLALMYGRK